jgi:hypothetical protein
VSSGACVTLRRLSASSCLGSLPGSVPGQRDARQMWITSSTSWVRADVSQLAAGLCVCVARTESTAMMRALQPPPAGS